MLFATRRWLSPAVLALLLTAYAHAQIGGGSIVGVVRDPAGAPVAGVKVRAHNQATNEEREVTTNADGYYEFPLMPAGPYHIETEATGFEKLKGEPFDLAA